ncbi:hypothetical protein [Psychroserpens sp.]|uniref:hypothetical protein n=1 Tax=Psychroserpens sp. TaxID=2020870 RepID=UPI00385DFA2A
MRSNFLLYAFICLIVIGCKTETQDHGEESSINNTVSKNITKKEIENLKYNDYLLSQDASNTVRDWQKYQELSTQIEYLKTAELSFFKNDITVMTAFINDFKAEIPKSISTNEINSRITALVTKLFKLNSELLLDNIPKPKKLEAIKEVLVAFSNLNLQINKKLEFEANNILKPE